MKPWSSEKEFSTVVIDENGQRKEYLPYAYFRYEEVDYLVMRTEESRTTSDSILLLQAHREEDGNPTFTLAETNPALEELISRSLGLSYGMVN